MKSAYTVGPNYEVVLPDEICDELDISIGDILIFKAVDGGGQIQILKHHEQTLSNDEVERAGNLSRVVPLMVED